jgi:hypothetical protein
MLSANEFKVDMLHIKIAEKNLAEGRATRSSMEPLEVTFNINTGAARLADGYHRYLGARGGSLESALLQSKQGVFPDYYVNVTLVKNESVGAFGTTEVPLSPNEIDTYLAHHLNRDARLDRAREQGFDVDKVWYHGTTPLIGHQDSDIESFSYEKCGAKYNQDSGEFFFTSSPTVASTYASHNSLGLSVNGGSVYPVFLKMTHPLVVDDLWCIKRGLPAVSSVGVIGFWDEYHEVLKKHRGEHDAILLTDNIGNHQMPVVFAPQQIRSINASFLPQDKESPSLLGHRFKTGIPPKKPMEFDVPAPAQQWIDAFKKILEDPSLAAPAKTKALLVSTGTPLSEWSSEARLVVYRRQLERDYQSLKVDDQAKLLATLAYETLSGDAVDAQPQPQEIHLSAPEPNGPRSAAFRR